MCAEIRLLCHFRVPPHLRGNCIYISRGSRVLFNYGTACTCKCIDNNDARINIWCMAELLIEAICCILHQEMFKMRNDRYVRWL